MPSAKVKPPSPAAPALVLLLFAASFAVSQAGVTCGESAASPSPAPSPTSTTANSTAFRANLETLLNALPKAAAPTGFATLSSGTGRDRAFVRGLCRGDTTASECLADLTDAVEDLSGRCGFNRSAGAWYERCYISYADSNDSASYEDRISAIVYDTRTVADPDSYDRSYYALMSDLVARAAWGSGGGGNGSGSARTSMFATGEAVYAASEPNGTLYGLVQCMRDRSEAECERCLQWLVPQLPECCDGHQGGVAQNFNCHLRVQIYTYYDLALDAPPPGPPAAPPPPSPDAPSPPVPSPSSGGGIIRGKRGSSKRAVVFAAAVSVGALLVVLFVLVCLRTQRRRTRANKAPRDDVGQESGRYVFPEQFTLPLLRAATGNFAPENKLGEGGFGQVFKGILPDGQEIAVKRLSQSSSQGFHELRNELLLAAKLLHRNLVRLHGACLEEREKLLVYEYLPNRSLDTVLFDNGRRGRRRRGLDWGKRYRIISGIARGLLYLHEESQLRVIHRDLKPSNVLLDEGMNPKISDFGLARAFRGDQSRDVTKRAAGTLGYMSPEYAYSGHVSTKSDMYSFGVIVLEIVTGRRNAGPCQDVASASASNLLSDVWEKWRAGKAAEIADASLGEHYPRSEMLSCVHIGLLCVQKKPAMRPEASEVVLMLSSQSTSRRTPSRPAFYSGHSTAGGVDSRVSRGNVSENGVTMSEFQPR
uniref:Uncharacterized protein n=1 Tax=Avena sativa TaxID=4498 RepID=A0ACD5VSL8_AVESA